MKTIIIAIIVMLTLGVDINAQDFKVFYPTNDVGFGNSSKMSKLMPWVVNGPIYDSNTKLTGGYIDNTDRKRVWADTTGKVGNFAVRNGIFGMTKSGKMMMVNYGDTSLLPPMQWAFQNGPILIYNGNNECNKFSYSKDTRSGIGYRRDGSLVVVISRNKCTPWQLAERMLIEGCLNAIYLDGNAPTGYATYDGNEIWGFNPNAIKLQFFKNPNRK